MRRQERERGEEQAICGRAAHTAAAIPSEAMHGLICKRDGPGKRRVERGAHAPGDLSHPPGTVT